MVCEASLRECVGIQPSSSAGLTMINPLSRRLFTVVHDVVKGDSRMHSPHAGEVAVQVAHDDDVLINCGQEFGVVIGSLRLVVAQVEVRHRDASPMPLQAHGHVLQRRGARLDD